MTMFRCNKRKQEIDIVGLENVLVPESKLSRQPLLSQASSLASQCLEGRVSLLFEAVNCCSNLPREYGYFYKAFPLRYNSNEMVAGLTGEGSNGTKCNYLCK